MFASSSNKINNICYFIDSSGSRFIRVTIHQGQIHQQIHQGHGFIRVRSCPVPLLTDSSGSGLAPCLYLYTLALSPPQNYVLSIFIAKNPTSALFNGSEYEPTQIYARTTQKSNTNIHIGYQEV